MYLLAEITMNKNLVSQHLTEAYLILQNLERGLAHLKLTNVFKNKNINFKETQEFYLKIIRVTLSNLNKNEGFKKP